MDLIIRGTLFGSITFMIKQPAFIHSGNKCWVPTMHLMQRTDSLEKTLMPGRNEGRREGDGRGWDDWMASSTRWTRVWASSGSWWWTGKPGVLQSMRLQRVGHDWVTELTDYAPGTNDTVLDLIAYTSAPLTFHDLTQCSPEEWNRSFSGCVAWESSPVMFPSSFLAFYEIPAGPSLETATHSSYPLLEVSLCLSTVEF